VLVLAVRPLKFASSMDVDGYRSLPSANWAGDRVPLRGLPLLASVGMSSVLITVNLVSSPSSVSDTFLPLILDHQQPCHVVLLLHVCRYHVMPMLPLAELSVVWWWCPGVVFRLAMVSVAL
jgi:hypothetical protein